MKPLGEKPKIPFPPLKFDISANRFLEEGKIYNRDFILFGGGRVFKIHDEASSRRIICPKVYTTSNRFDWKQPARESLRNLI